MAWSPNVRASSVVGSHVMDMQPHCICPFESITLYAVALFDADQRYGELSGDPTDTALTIIPARPVSEATALLALGRHIPCTQLPTRLSLIRWNLGGETCSTRPTRPTRHAPVRCTAVGFPAIRRTHTTQIHYWF